MLHPITSVCNQKCIFCSAYGRVDRDFNLKIFIKELSDDNDRLIAISGGEPFTVGIDNLIYIISYLLKNKKQVEIQTNAVLPAEIERGKLKLLISLVNKTEGYFNINLSSHNSSYDFKLTQLKDGFTKRIKSIKILNELGAKIRITFVINKLNYKIIPEFATFVVKKIPFIDWIQFSYIKGIGKASKNKSLIPPYNLVSPYLIKGFEILEKNKIEFDTDHIPLCFLGRFYLRHVDINKLKNKIKGDYLKEKSKIKGCNGCKFYRICSGPRKDYIEVYGKL